MDAMTALTRDLLPYALSRVTMELVTLVTLFPTLLDDGSADFFKQETRVKARVAALTPDEIERLQTDGITLKEGVSCAVTGELVKAPANVIRADGTLMTVMQFTIDEGASVMLLDIPSLGNDGPSYQSGYVP